MALDIDTVLFALRVALALLLYAFLAAAFWLLRRDLLGAAREAAARRRRYGRLTVVEAPDASLPPGTRFPLLPVTSLGRSPSNTITLPDGYASAEHALLVYRGGQWWLQDQGSRNGTSLNGEPVVSDVVVSAGDIIGIGRVQLKIELD